jgi:hypothetical protein
MVLAWQNIIAGVAANTVNGQHAWHWTAELRQRSEHVPHQHVRAVNV